MIVRNVPQMSFIAAPRVLGSKEATTIVTRGAFTTTSGELLGLYRVAGGLRFGLGVRQSYADLKGTGISAGDWRFTATPGVVLEAQYLFSNNDGAFVSTGPEFGFALRLVSEKFQDPFDKTYSGDHFEVGMLINF